MSDSLSISKIYEIFAQKSGLVNRFVALQNEYAGMPRDYGDGVLFTMAEIHMLAYIEEHPGVTGSEIAAAWRRTKGAVSQTVKKLEQHGYIYRERCPSDGKRSLLYVTGEGEKMSLLHKRFDVADLKATLDRLLEHCGISEVDTFFKVIEAYNLVLQKEIEEDL